MGNKSFKKLWETNLNYKSSFVNNKKHMKEK